jgi:general secretion pathway protein G
MTAIENRRRMRGQGGFTLIELLIVIAILGILAGVVVFAVGNVTDNADTKACELERRTIKTAIEAAKGNNTTLSASGDIVTSGFLEEEPDVNKWTFQATPYGWQGTGECVGLSAVSS